MPPSKSAKKEPISDRFRPQFLFTLDQIAIILSISVADIFDYVWTENSKTPPGNRMQGVIIQNYQGRREIRVSESQLNAWADKNGFAAMRYMV